MSDPHMAGSPDAEKAGATVPDFDVAIVGAGLSGSIAAIQLSRMGFRVALFDLQEQPRAEFRAEQLVGGQIGRLAELGVLQPMTRESRATHEVVNGRKGKVLDRTRVDQYGVPYQSMVEGVRSQVPADVRLIAKRVAAIATSPDLQQVTLADGSAVSSRLVVMATGLASVLTKRLGIEIATLRANQSLAIGFDVAVADTVVTHLMPLVYYGENGGDMTDYIALFAVQGAVRANLFCYQDQQSEWTRSFCRDPRGALLQIMPGLGGILGPFQVTSPVQVRSNDLRVAINPARDGVVLIGDAFQTPCPAAGTGIDRLLSDIDVLCRRHVVDWFATPGMARAKIEEFYADPVKQAFDAECLRIADYRRAVSTRRNLWWTVHRKQVFFRRRLKALLAKRLGREGQLPAAGSMAG